MNKLIFLLAFCGLLVSIPVDTAHAAPETFRIQVSGTPRENMPIGDIGFYDTSAPNSAASSCTAAGLSGQDTYVSNITIEKLTGAGAPETVPAYYQDQSCKAVASLDINPTDTVRVSAAMPAGTYCDYSNGEAAIDLPPFFRNSFVDERYVYPQQCSRTFNGISNLTDGGYIEVLFHVQPLISPITNFTVTARNLVSEPGAGFNFSWTDTVSEDNYQLRWTRTVDGTSGTINYPRSLVSTPTVPGTVRRSWLESATNTLCDGSNVLFTLYAYTSYQQVISPTVSASCSRGYRDISSLSAFGTMNTASNNFDTYSTADLQSSLNTSFNNVPDKRMPTTLPIDLPIYIPNTSSTSTVMGTITVITRVRYASVTDVSNPSSYLIARSGTQDITAPWTSTTNTLTNIEEYVISTTTANNSQRIYVQWPGVRQANENVQVDVTIQIQNYRDEGGVIMPISTINTSNIWSTSTGINYSSATAPPLPDPNAVPADGLVPNAGSLERSRSQIGYLGFVPGAFRDIAVVSAGKSYDMKVAITGTTSTAEESSTEAKATMLILDVTGSMNSSVVYGGRSISRLNAAKEALKAVIDMTGNDNYLGLGAFVVCDGPWNSQLFPNLVWSYERTNPSINNRETGNGVILQSLTKMTTTEKTSLKGVIDRLALNSFPRINLCAGHTHGSSTDFGGGLTVGLAEFLRQRYTGTDPTQAYTLSDGFNDGSTRVLSNNVLNNVRRYMIFASDGEQNIYPYSTSPDIYPRGTTSVTPIVNARNERIPVYTISMGAPASRQSLEYIADQTGGKFQETNTGDELVQSFKNIYEDIQSSTSSTSITYQLNTNSFEFGDLTDARIRILQAGQNEQPLYSCSENSSTTPNCVINRIGGTITIRAPIIRARERLYLYFKVIPKNVSDQIDGVFVNRDPDSTVTFVNVNPADGYPIDNVSVVVIPQEGYFRTHVGNVYSRMGVASYIPEEIPLTERFFATDTEPTVFVGNPLDPQFKWQFGAGRINPEQRVSRNYSVQYDSLLNYVKTTSSDIETLNSSQPNNSIWQAASNTVYVFNNPDGTLVLPGLPSASQSLNKNKVVFSEGEIFINGDLRVEPGHILIVNAKKGIRIGKSVAQVDGILMTEGRIFTYCDRSDFSCTKEPVISTDPALRLEGMFIANNGFNLGRRGKVTQNPPIAGETFVMRPDFLIYATNYLGEKSVTFTEISE